MSMPMAIAEGWCGRRRRGRELREAVAAALAQLRDDTAALQGLVRATRRGKGDGVMDAVHESYERSQRVCDALPLLEGAEPLPFRDVSRLAGLVASMAGRIEALEARVAVLEQREAGVMAYWSAIAADESEDMARRLEATRHLMAGHVWEGLDGRA